MPARSEPRLSATSTIGGPSSAAAPSGSAAPTVGAAIAPEAEAANNMTANKSPRINALLLTMKEHSHAYPAGREYPAGRVTR